jgi:mannose-6-phosphate isomerase
VASGPHQGETLAELAARDGEGLLGKRLEEIPGHAFPLLVKFLDARENLSIQVHPDDVYAQRVETQPFGKCEMWYVVAAEPGARVFQGLRRALSEDELRAALQAGKLVDELVAVEVRPGDVLLNLPGTVHALGAGVVVYELQQSSDLTYRLYDWDRGASGGTARELHLDRGLDVIDREPHRNHLIEPVQIAEDGYSRAFLCACRYFVGERLTVPERALLADSRRRFQIITVLAGHCHVHVPGARHRVGRALEVGESALVPARAEKLSIDAVDGPCQVIRAYVPDLLGDVVEPLRARGIEPERIVQLGGDPRRSDLAAYVG